MVLAAIFRNSANDRLGGVQMLRLMAVSCLIGMGVIALAGCASLPGPDRSTRAVKKDLLFSPEWAGMPTFDVARSSWPSTASHLSAGEVVDYQETILDFHGRSRLGRNDDYYRRFQSVRVGRLYR